MFRQAAEYAAKGKPSMPIINFDLPADLFWARSARRVVPKGGVAHRRFETLAEGICFVVEEDQAERYGVSIDTDENSFSKDEIEALYRSEGFSAYREKSQGSPSAKP